MLSLTPPAGFEFAFKEYLFNSENHRKSQILTGWQSFYWLDFKKNAITAVWHLHINENDAISPYRATFGGPQFSSGLPLRDLTTFIQAVTEYLKERNIKAIKTILPPQGYDNAQFVKMYQAYSDSDYYPTKSEIVAGIPIDSHSFESIIHTSERKKLKRCIHHGLIFKQGLIEDYIEIYDLISTCREERGHHLSLSKSDLKNIIEQQTEAFSYYSVSNDGKMVAAAICIHISQEIYYVFYGGHLKAYDKLSPAVLLYKGIYDICQQRNIRRLDFGTSPDGEGTNHDLLDFKRYLGSDLSLKITFSKEL